MKAKLTALALLSAFALAHAQTVTVDQPWVRPTVPGQKGTGGFATITSKADAQLVGVRAAVAGVGEVHEMKMEPNGTMRMSAVKAIELPAGKPVELKPGGLHIMLLDLKTALPKDTTVPVVMQFKGKDGKTFEQTVSFAVTPRAPAGTHGTHGTHKH